MFVEYKGTKGESIVFSLGGKTYISSKVVSHKIETMAYDGTTGSVHVVTTITGSTYVYGFRSRTLEDGTMQVLPMTETCYNFMVSMYRTVKNVIVGAWQGAKAGHTASK